MVRKVFTWIAVILMIVGSINWMLVGIFDFNLVLWLTFGSEIVADIVYILVGLAAIWMIIYLSTLSFVKEERYGRGGSGERRESYGRADNRRNAQSYRNDRRRENYDKKNGNNNNYRNY